MVGLLENLLIALDRDSAVKAYDIRGVLDDLAQACAILRPVRKPAAPTAAGSTANSIGGKR